MTKKQLYPGVDEAERERTKAMKEESEEPDFIGGKPNYDKFQKWSTEKVLSWLNID